MHRQMYPQSAWPTLVKKHFFLIKIVIYYFQRECGLMKTEIKVAAAERDSTFQLIS